MKILRISDKNAEYSIDGINYTSITNISRDDLKVIVEYIMNNDDVILDEVTEENRIVNKAEEIIYADIYNKLNDLKDKKTTIIEKVELKFKNLIEKYELEKIED